MSTIFTSPAMAEDAPASEGSNIEGEVIACNVSDDSSISVKINGEEVKPSSKRCSDEDRKGVKNSIVIDGVTGDSKINIVIGGKKFTPK